MRISDWSSDVCSSDLLLDHRIDGRGVLPAAGAVEWMAQFVTAAWPGWHVVEMRDVRQMRSEEHTSELQSLMRISYAVFCLKKKNTNNIEINSHLNHQLDINRFNIHTLNQN